MSKYEIIVYWSDDEAFIAEVPELPGCAADGATYREAIGNVEVIIEEWLETVDSKKPNIGLTTWKYSPKRKIWETDVVIAKNYL